MRGFLVLSGALLSACAAASPPEAPVLEHGDAMLARCDKDEQEPDVRAFRCGQLTAVETVVLAASPQEIALAFDQFAARFPGQSPRRVDSVYTAGQSRHTWMRLEGSGEAGRPVEAQMVAVVTGDGARLVICSSRDPDAPCGPVVASLVHAR